MELSLSLSLSHPSLSLSPSLSIDRLIDRALYWIVFANGPGDRGSIPGQLISKSQKKVLDATLLNTQQYKLRIKGKVEQSREWSCTVPYTSMQKKFKKEPSGYPWLKSPTLILHVDNSLSLSLYIYIYNSLRIYIVGEIKEREREGGRGRERP